MVGQPPGGSDRAPSPDAQPGVTHPDPERIRAGWHHRFVAAGARADEMIALYRELGYEVASDPVRGGTAVEGCAACFGSGGEEHRAIYTRRPSGPDAAVGRSDGESHVPDPHATRVLREEHRQILRVAEVLDGLLDRDLVDTDFDRVAGCIRYIRLFADACHHGKEEDLLFPALVEQGLPVDSGPIAVMLHEHRLGRQHASAMADSIDAARAGDATALARLVRAGRDYVALIRGHILKEDNVLFNMADRLVVGARCAHLCQAYDRTASHTFGGCSKAELEELGREILAGA